MFEHTGFLALQFCTAHPSLGCASRKRSRIKIKDFLLVSIGGFAVCLGHRLAQLLQARLNTAVSRHLGSRELAGADLRCDKSHQCLNHFVQVIIRRSICCCSWRRPRSTRSSLPSSKQPVRRKAGTLPSQFLHVARLRLFFG